MSLKKSTGNNPFSGQGLVVWFDHWIEHPTTHGKKDFLISESVSGLFFKRSLIPSLQREEKMEPMVAEIKRTTNQIANGIGMVGILCLAMVLGMLSVVGAEDFLE